MPSAAPVMQAVSKTHKSGCHLHIDVDEDRDPGLPVNESGQRYNKKRIGPRTNHCRTPHTIKVGDDDVDTVLTDWYRQTR